MGRGGRYCPLIITFSVFFCLGESSSMANGLPEGASPRAIFMLAALDGSDMDVVASSSGDGGTLMDANMPAAFDPAPERPGAMGNEAPGGMSKI